MFLQDVFDDLFERVDGLHRRVAQIEARLEFARDDVGCARAGVQIRDLKARGLEIFVAGVPFSRREFGECRRERVHRIFGLMRIGHVALHAVHGEAARERTAATDLDGVADGLFARGFADDAIVDAFAAGVEGLDDALGAIDRGAFFVAGDQKCDRAAVARMGADEFFGGGDHGRETAFHVGRAASVEHAIADGRHEGVAAPFFEWPGRHDVGMACEAEQWPLATPDRPKILDVAVTQRFDGEPQRLETLTHDLLTAGIGRGDGVAGHEVLGECEGRRHGATL